MMSSVNVALPAIQKEFAIDAVLLSWISTAFLLSTAIFVLPVGKAADIYGRKRFFVIGLSIFTLVTFLCAFVRSAHALIVMRAFQGLGGAMVMTTGMAIIASVFPPNERGRAIGMNVAAVYAGLSLGPLTGGLLTEHLGWRSIFLISAPFGLTSIIVTAVNLKSEWADAKGQKFDFVGSILFAAAISALMYGASTLNKPGASKTTSGIAVAAGLVLLLVFAAVELRVAFPVFDLHLLARSRVFAFSSLAALINYSATFSVTFLLSLYLQYIKGLPPAKAGMFLAVQPLVMALFSPVAGFLSDRIEPGKIASVGMGLCAAGLLALAGLDNSTSLTAVAAALVALGMGFGLFSSPNMNAIMSSVERKFYGIASGTVATMRLFGQMISMGAVTVVFSIMIGPAAITPEKYGAFIASLKTLFTFSAIMCFAGIFLSLARGSLRKQNG